MGRQPLRGTLEELQGPQGSLSLGPWLPEADLGLLRTPGRVQMHQNFQGGGDEPQGAPQEILLSCSITHPAPEMNWSYAKLLPRTGCWEGWEHPGEEAEVSGFPPPHPQPQSPSP